MSFVLVSSEDIFYGPTCISTEDSALHQQISDISDSTKYLTISSRRKKTEGSSGHKSDKSEKIKAKFEAKLKELKDKPEKAEKLKEKMEKMTVREKERIAVMDDKKVKFDPNSKALVIKVEDAPVRVLNKLAALGYQITPSSSGGSGSAGGSRAGQVWTLFRPGYVPQMYPELNNLNIKDY